MPSSSVTLEQLDVSEDIITNLKKRGLSATILASTPIIELESRFSIPRRAAAHYQQQVLELLAEKDVQNAYELYQYKRDQDSFTTGASNLDNLLMIPEYNSFGIRLGETYELSGPHKSGKTLLVHQLCLTVQLSKHLGGLEKKALFIDTDITFSPAKLLAFTRGFDKEFNVNLDPKQLLSNVLCARATTTDRQFLLIYTLLEVLEKHPSEFGLLVVDSVIRNFRAEYPGINLLAQRQQQINQFLSLLSRIARDYNVAVVVTNQVMADIDTYIGQGYLPAGGHVVSHWADHRLFIRNASKKQRLFTILDSSEYPPLDTILEITTDGISDPNLCTEQYL